MFADREPVGWWFGIRNLGHCLSLGTESFTRVVRGARLVDWDMGRTKSERVRMETLPYATLFSILVSALSGVCALSQFSRSHLSLHIRLCIYTKVALFGKFFVVGSRTLHIIPQIDEVL